jgi:hypothetical protein
MNHFLDIQAAAEFLCRSPRWIRTQLPGMPHYRPPGGQILFSEEDLRQWMSRYRVEPKLVDLGGMLKRVCGKTSGAGGRNRSPRSIFVAGKGINDA